MPRGDRTGPAGMGSMTGRALGYCAGYPHPGFAAGQGRGMGRGFGHRNRFWARLMPFGQHVAGAYGGPMPPASAEQVQALQQQADVLRQSLQSIEKQLECLRQAESEAE